MTRLKSCSSSKWRAKCKPPPIMEPWLGLLLTPMTRQLTATTYLAWRSSTLQAMISSQLFKMMIPPLLTRKTSRMSSPGSLTKTSLNRTLSLQSWGRVSCRWSHSWRAWITATSNSMRTSIINTSRRPRISRLTSASQNFSSLAQTTPATTSSRSRAKPELSWGLASLNNP